MRKTKCLDLSGQKHSAVVLPTTSPPQRSNSVRKTTSRSSNLGILQSSPVPASILGPAQIAIGKEREPNWFQMGSATAIKAHLASEGCALRRHDSRSPSSRAVRQYSRVSPMLTATAVCRRASSIKVRISISSLRISLLFQVENRFGRKQPRFLFWRSVPRQDSCGKLYCSLHELSLPARLDSGT